MHWSLPLASVGLWTTFWATSAGEQIVLSPPSFKLPAGSKPSHQITSYLRTIDVAGTITREQAVVKLKRGPGGGKAINWLLPVEDQRASNMSFMEVVEGEGKKAEGAQKRVLNIVSKGLDQNSKTHFFEIEWPQPVEDELVLTVNSHFLNLTAPKPERLRQEEGAKQGMYWQGDLLGGFGAVPGAFSKEVEVKVKIKSPTPRVFQHTAPPGFNVQQATGSNYVIFTSKLDGTELAAEPQWGYVHFFQPHPVMVIANLTRLVEVSHWGNNVAIEDRIELENRGPALRGPFSRLAHQNSIYTRAPGATAHILTGLTLELPAGASSPYYIDTIGNVSTSRFRPSLPLVPAGQQSKFKKPREAKSSKLELTPRYPIAGGWNYTFTVGYNLEAGRLLKQKDAAEYVLKVPFFTNAVDVPVELATLRVRLPEGSSNIQAFTPFPATETRTDLVDKTYLDTTGRPTIFIKKVRCTEKHSGDIYITYSRSPMKSLQKPAAVAGWMMTIFLVAAGAQRLQWKIGY